MQLEKATTRRLRTIVECDPTALVRVLQLFQMRNVVPRQIVARRLGAEYQEAEIEIDAQDLDADTFRLILARIQQIPVVLTVVDCP